MPVLNFPPPRKMASRVNTPEALANKHNINIATAMLEQALSNVSAYSQAMRDNLLVRACHAYLAERGQA